jgi:hypothetical protein
MENLLYSFFIENNHNSLISFQRIKRFLSNIHFDEEIGKNRLESLYKLLNNGVIDYAGNSNYYMSPSIIINAENFKIGINLPIDVIETNKEKIITQNTGIILFNIQEIVLNDWDIMNVDYKFDNYLSNFISIFKIPLNWEKVQMMFPTNSIKIEIFNPENFKWSKAENSILTNSLYKVYPYPNDCFEYYFNYKQNWYRIKAEEFDKSSLAKTILILNAKLAYNPASNVLSIPKYFPLPSFIEKLLFLNHCLAKGKFPENRNYFIERKDFKKVNKVIFNNHIKIAADE